MAMVITPWKIGFDSRIFNFERLTFGEKAVEKGDGPCRQYQFVTEKSLVGKGQSPFSSACQTQNCFDF
jgi:hypothetical protein